MFRIAAAVGLVALFSGSASAQDASDSSTAGKTPAENNQTGNIAARSPGSWVNQARQRHSGFINLRVKGDPRTADRSEMLPGSGGTSGSSDGGLGALGSLLGLLGGSGGTPGLSDLLDLADQAGVDTNALLGSGGSTNTGSSSGGNGLTEDDLPQELLDLRDLANQQTQQIRNDSPFGGVDLFAADKDDARSQQQNDEPRFRTRLVDSLLQTTFTALTFAFQTPDFIDMLADVFRPIFAPPSDDTENAGADAPADGASGQDADNQNAGDLGDGSVV